jgi:hypothetical protein
MRSKRQPTPSTPTRWASCSGLMAAELADARALPWEKAFAEFARSGRDSSTAFKYAELSYAHLNEYKRERKLLAERPWLDFGPPHLWVLTSPSRSAVS